MDLGTPAGLTKTLEEVPAWWWKAGSQPAGSQLTEVCGRSSQEAGKWVGLAGGGWRGGSDAERAVGSGA